MAYLIKLIFYSINVEFFQSFFQKTLLAHTVKDECLIKAGKKQVVILKCVGLFWLSFCHTAQDIAKSFL